MIITFLGVGEAFDKSQPNTSILIQAQEKTLLIDCGYSLPQKLWQFHSDPNLINAVYLSHAHADHYFGLPAIIARMSEDGRNKPLTILGHKQTLEKAQQMIPLAYSNLLERNIFKLKWQPVTASQKPLTPTNLPFQLQFAPTNHAIPNLAVRVRHQQKSICYSGDGQPTKQSLALFKHCQLLIHESYFLEKNTGGHSSVKQQIELIDNLEVERLALVHIQRTILQNRQEAIKKLLAQVSTNVVQPEPGDQIKI